MVAGRRAVANGAAGRGHLSRAERASRHARRCRAAAGDLRLGGRSRHPRAARLSRLGAARALVIYRPGMPSKATTKAKSTRRSAGLRERLEAGPVICAEGYLFEFERRGYLQAGAYVPEVVLEHPDLVESLHRDFVHAGSDVVEAFTYYAHRAKLKIIGREKDLAKINRGALAPAGR